MFFGEIRKIVSVLGGLFAALALSGQANAEVISLDFSSLPSTQGWDFAKATTGNHADDTEGGVFSVASNTLTLDTMSDGFVEPSDVGYVNTDVVDRTRSWTLEWTLRIVDYETPVSGLDFGSWFGVYNDVSAVGVAISGDSLSVYNGIGGSSIASDNTDFQDFRLEYTPDLNAGTFELFVDNALVTSGAGRQIGGDLFHSDNQLYIGDASGGANSEWEMTSYVFSQPAPAVPEPSVWVLWVGLGVMGLIVRRQRRLLKSVG